MPRIKIPKDYSEKYVWSATTFEQWIKEQQRILANSGFKISTSGVTHKLVVDVLLPNDIKLQFPKMQFNFRNKKKS